MPRGILITNARNPNCSDESDTFPNTAESANANAVVEWGISPLVTPTYYTATFSDDITNGDLLACLETPNPNADVCPYDDIVKATIDELVDPSGIILFTGQVLSCNFSSPHFRVPGHDGWYWTVTLIKVEDDGDASKTEWTIQAYIVNWRHGHDEGNVGGIEGLKYNCVADRDIHRIYYAQASQAQYNCNAPPNDDLDNSLDCTVAHAADDPQPADGHDNYEPCAHGGSVVLEAGWV